MAKPLGSYLRIIAVIICDNIVDVYDCVLIIKLNILTGKTYTWYEQYDPSPSTRLKFIF